MINKKRLSKLFCKHNYAPSVIARTHTEDNQYIYRTLWKCTKCGKEKIDKRGHYGA